MINYNSTCFTKTYYELLSFSLESTKNFIKTRSGFARDLGPLCIEISKDNFRMPVLQHRGFNPIFALCEFAWIISGSNKLHPLTNYISSFSNYSDDSINLNGAYGYRLRHNFGFDQIEKAIKLLKINPNSRRVVLQLWATDDLGKESKDIPCNTQIMLKVRNNKLDITTTNRSNDLFLGLPYNIFTFFMLQNYVSKSIDIDIGKQYHFTDSIHMYKKDMASIKKVIKKNTMINYDKLIPESHSFDWGDIVNNINVHSQLLTKDLISITNNLIGEAAKIYLSKENKNFTKNTFIPDNNLLTLATFLWAKTYNRFCPFTDYPFEREIFNEF